MPAHWWRATWVTVALCAAVLAGVLGADIHTAHAKSLGGVTSQTLFGRKISVSAITDKFDKTNGANLTSTADVNGDTWQVGPGAFKIVNPGTDGYAAPTTSPGEATVPGAVNAAVGIDLNLATTSTGCGVVLNAAGPSSYAATFLVYDRNAKTLTLERLLASGAVSWSVGPVSKTTVNTYLWLTYSNGTYTAWQDGVKIWTQVLTTPQRTEAEAYSRIGFGSVSGTTCKFDNFQAYAL
jgi:hypothetical protein